MKKIQVPLQSAAFILMMGLSPVFGQVSDTITKSQANDILTELRLIRQMLERQIPPAAPPRPTTASVSISMTDPFLGKKDAPITIVEFTDYQCAYCQRFHMATFPDIKKKYIDTGFVRFYSRDMPLDFHANAMKAAVAARCAGDQNMFWDLRDVLVANADKLDPASIAGYAGKLSMNQVAFKACVEGNKYEAVVKANLEEAGRLGVEGTPTFIVGKSSQEGVNGTLVVGAQLFPTFEKLLDGLLAAKN